MLRRLLTASFVALLVAGVLPAGVLAAAPAAGDVTTSTNEDTAATITLTATDAGGADLSTFAFASQPLLGTLDPVGAPVCPPGTPGTCTADVVYHPNPDENGSDSFTYTATGLDGTSAPATVTITVHSVNDPPSFTAGGSVTVDEDSGAYLHSWATNPSTGPANEAGQSALFLAMPDDASLFAGTDPKVAILPTGELAFTPKAGAHGSTAVTVVLMDNGGHDAPSDDLSDEVVFTITITSVNDAPVASAGSGTPNEDEGWLIHLSATDADGDPVTSAQLATAPTHGTVEFLDPITCGGGTPNTCQIDAVYTATDKDYHGPDSFTYTATDGTNASAPATVLIDILPVNDVPVCTDDATSIDEGGVLVSAIDTCSDVDGDSQTYWHDDPAHGTLSMDPAGSFTYEPDPEFHGTDGFWFIANDGTADSSPPANYMTITVTSVNDAPVCTGDASSGPEDAGQVGTIGTCSDIDDDPLTYTRVANATHGSATVNKDGSWTYTPAANFNGADSFTFRANDGTVDSAPATVSITVTDVNDPPSANSESSGFFGFPYVAATTATTLNVLANDTSGPRIGGVTSEPADPITITSVSGAGRGTVSILPGGTALAYDPRGCLTGDDVFSYTVTDGHGETDPATVAVTVARPGAGGLGNAPITDVPSVGLRSGASIGRTVPVRVNWCGVVKSTSRIQGFRVEQSASAGASWPTLVTRSTTATSSRRSIGTSGTYAWRVRTTDTSSRTGAYRASATAKASIRQETPAATVVYAGAWRTSSTSKASGGRMRSATSTSSSVTITVAAGARQVGIVAPKGSSFGSFKVWVDGAYAGRFSERASLASYRRMLFVRSVNPGAAHTIVLKPAGNGRVYLDAIVTLQ